MPRGFAGCSSRGHVCCLSLSQQRVQPHLQSTLPSPGEVLGFLEGERTNEPGLGVGEWDAFCPGHTASVVSSGPLSRLRAGSCLLAPQAPTELESRPGHSCSARARLRAICLASCLGKHGHKGFFFFLTLTERFLPFWESESVFPFYGSWRWIKNRDGRKASSEAPSPAVTERCVSAVQPPSPLQVARAVRLQSGRAPLSPPAGPTVRVRASLGPRAGFLWPVACA